MKKSILYKPSLIDIIFDAMILILGIFVVFKWYPFTTENPFEKYFIPSLIYILLWTCSSYFSGRYRPLYKQKYLRVNLRLFSTSWIVFGLLCVISLFFFQLTYSIYLIFFFTTIIFGVFFLFYVIYFAILYAVEYEDIQPETHVSRENADYKHKPDLDAESYNALVTSVKNHVGENIYKILSDYTDFKSGGNLVLFTAGHYELGSKADFQFSSIINVELLNNFRGINRLFSLVNSKLANDGYFITVFESKSTRKKRILTRYPKYLNYFIYSIDFVIRRIVPKIFITRRLYYDITKGKKRILSKTEVLGRLYYCGFRVVAERKTDQLNIIVARRFRDPEPQIKKTYGPLIRLKRIGKNGVKFNVYKFRTMHPYSEYLQAYIFERNKLREGGKFNRDVRVTTLGRFMRRYWLDELPMLMNVVNGDMKIVGVRPLSAHYFSLYSAELQAKRVNFKPGLLPPFYADMPKTLDEIQSSEMKYLNECEKNGVLITDIKYLFIILRNILLKKARSA